MGLIGWADAPNSAESNTTSPQTPQQASTVVPANMPEPDSLESQQGGIADSVGFEEDDDFGYVNEVSVSRSVISVNDWSDGVSLDVDKEQEATIELLNAIRGLRLNQRAQDGATHCDISKFELHEVKFLFDHAERCGFDDYFVAVKEVFGVKHRILDEVGDIDAVESPNLDELLAFVEAKYEKRYGGDEE